MKTKYIDNSPKYGSIDFREHRDLEIKFQQEFAKQLGIYPCFNIIARDCAGNNLFDVKSRFKGMVLERIYLEDMENRFIEDDIQRTTSTFIRFMLQTITRGYSLISSDYEEFGYIKIPSSFKLSEYIDFDINVESPMEIAKLYSTLTDIKIEVKLPDMAIEWEFDSVNQKYSIIYGFRIGLKVQDREIK